MLRLPCGGTSNVEHLKNTTSYKKSARNSAASQKRCVFWIDKDTVVIVTIATLTKIRLNKPDISDYGIRVSQKLRTHFIFTVNKISFCLAAIQ